MPFNSLNGHRWFPVATFVHGSHLCNSPGTAVPRSSQTGRRPPGYFELPKQFGGAPPSPGAPGGGQAFFPRGSREEPGSPASKISKGLWAVDLESHLAGLALGKEVPHDTDWRSNTLRMVLLILFDQKFPKMHSFQRASWQMP